MIDLLHSLDLEQTINELTHEYGHTIDLVVCSQADNLVKSSYVFSQVSDHCVSKPYFTCKRVFYRKIGPINVEQFKKDISNSEMMCEPTSSVDGLVSQYNCTLKNLLDKHVHQKSCLVLERTMEPWYTDKISEAKCWKRKLEKQMKRTGLTVHHGMFKTARLNYES